MRKGSRHNASHAVAGARLAKSILLRYALSFCLRGRRELPSQVTTGTLLSRLEKPSVLSGHCLVALATLDVLQIDTAEHHRQRHAVDFDRQRCRSDATWHLKATSFQPLCPDH